MSEKYHHHHLSESGINIFLEEKNALISVTFIFLHQFFIPINLSSKESISEHLIQSNPDFLCQISQRQTLSDRNMSAASGDGDCSLASCSLVSTVSELSAGVATGSELDNLIRAKYNLF